MTYAIPVRSMNGWIKKNKVTIEWATDSYNDPNYGNFCSIVPCHQDMLMRFMDHDDGEEARYGVAILCKSGLAYDVTVGAKKDLEDLWYYVVGDVMYDEGESW